MASEPFAVKGIILSSDEYKDKDRMLTILTSNLGIIKVCSKRSGKQNSKTQFLSVPYMLCDFTLSDSHGFLYVKEALIIESNSLIFGSLEAMAVASHISEILSKAVLQSDISAESYELAVYSFYALSKYPENYRLIYAAFNLKFLAISGLAVPFEICSNCKESIFTKDKALISLNSSECFCNECAKVSKINGNTFKISCRTIRFINYIVEKNTSSIFTLSVDDTSLDELVIFSTSYLSFGLDEEVINPISRLSNTFNRFKN